MDAMEGKTSTKLYVHQISVPSGDGSPNTVTVGDYAAAFHVSESGGKDRLYILFLRQSMAEVQETMKNTTMETPPFRTVVPILYSHGATK